MKSKEIIQLAVALVILAVAGFLIYSQLAPANPKSDETKFMVEKVRPIEPDYDQQTLAKISDSSRVTDYYNEPDLKTGLGNTQPFDPLK